MPEHLTALSGEESNLRGFILDILHYDIESLDTLIRHLNIRKYIGWRDFWPHDFTAEEVLPVLEVLLDMGMVELLSSNETTGFLEKVDSADSVSLQQIDSSFWFRLTNEGFDEWKDWKPPQRLSSRSNPF